VASLNASPALDADQAFANCTRWVNGADGACGPAGRIAESHLAISGMWCAACAPTIEGALRGVAGVRDARVSAAAARALVRWDPARAGLDELIGAVQRAGYGAAPDGVAAPRGQRLRESRLALWRFFVAAFCSMQVMMFLTPSYVSGPGELDADMRRLLAWGAWTLTLPVLAFSAAPFFAGAWRSLKHRRIGMDVPVALGLAVTFVASTAAMVDPLGPFGAEVYFDSLTMFVAFLIGARWFETRARHRAAAWLEDAARKLPDTARRVRDDGFVEAVAAHRLVAGERLRVPLGERFAADGVLIDGPTEVDEAILTGESRPLRKAVGANVLAGSVNLGRVVDMRVTAVGPDTRQAGIVALMRDTAMQRPQAARLADRWAAPFLWVVLILAAGSALVWSVVDPSRAVWVAVSVLIVTCPCALSLAVPSAQLAATGFLARRGLLLRRIEALEALAHVRRIAFDKTGTLTRERQALRLEGASTDEGARRRAWQAAVSLAQASTHPVSRAIAAAARAAGVDAGDGVTAWREIREAPAHGMVGIDSAGVEWRLGSRAWVTGKEEEGGDDASAVAWLAARGDDAAWRFAADDETMRAGAEDLGASLAALDVDLAIISGDVFDRVDAAARRIGARTVVAEADPDAKLAALRSWQRQGMSVAMVGDGVNDAPVIAQADVSIAMGEGASVTRSEADAVLVGGDVSVLPRAVMQARRCVRVVRQNLAWAAAYNLACIPLAMLGWLPPWAAGLGMAASSLAVIANAQRLAR
jgi:Cu2+-exporting ATPase